MTRRETDRTKVLGLGWGRDGRRGETDPTAFHAHAGRDAFVHVTHGRGPESLAMVGFGLVFATIAFFMREGNDVAGIFVLAGIALAGFGAYRMAANESWGMTLDDEHLTVFDGDWFERVPLAEIEEIDMVTMWVREKNRRRKETLVRVVRHDRSRFEVPSKCRPGPDELEFHAIKRGIPVVRGGDAL